MIGISHEQARQFLQAADDGLLGEPEQAALQNHLSKCAECRAYASELNALDSSLRATFHSHWDNRSQPARQLVPVIQAQSRRISMHNRVATDLRLLAGAVLVLALVIELNYIIAQRPQVSTRPTQMSTQTPTSSPQTSPTSVISANPTSPTVNANMNRLIALTLKTSGNPDIYVMHADGSGLTNISHDPSIDRNPVWSPDGRRLAFESNRTGNFDIFVMNTDGSGLINISNNPADESLGANQWQNYRPWAPDAHRLVFKSDRGGKTAWYVAGTDTAESAIKISDAEETQVSWSPDGREIATVENNSEIFVMNADGTEKRSIQNKAGCKILGWLPDRLNIYSECETPDGQWVISQVNTQAGSVEKISTILQLAFPPAVDSFWLGRDASLAYALRADSGNGRSFYRIENGKSVPAGNDAGDCTNYYRFSSMSNTSALLLSTTQCEGANTKLQVQNLVEGTSRVVGELDTSSKTASTYAEWSLDDQLVLVNISTESLSQIYVIPRDDLRFPLGTLGPVFTSRDLVSSLPVIQPLDTSQSSPQTSLSDGRLIAYASTQNGNSDIYILPISGGEAVNITNSPGTDRNPVWSPDGTRIVFESDRMGKFDVFVVNADGSGLINLSNDPAFDELSTTALNANSPWSPDGSRLIFQSYREGHAASYVANADGSGKATKFSDSASFAFWSPDGQQIVYAYNLNDDQPDTVYVIDADGSHRMTIQQDSHVNDLRWSPDGKMIYIRENYANDTWDIKRITLGANTPPETMVSVSGSFGMAWLAQNPTLVYQTPDNSLHRTDGKTENQVAQFDTAEICGSKTGASYPGNIFVSNKADLAISYTNCRDTGKVIITVHDLRTATSRVLGELSVNPEQVYITWSQDDRVAMLYVLQSGATQSVYDYQTSLYIFQRDNILLTPAPLTPVWQQMNGMDTIPAIQPMDTQPRPNP